MPSDSNETTRSMSPSHQLLKLKRFLSTLYHFGSDISKDIGEHIRALILALLNNALSVEEFHSKVQTATNFPLRPFALPFLKSNLPLLQKDLSQLARQSKQSSSQYLAQHEDFVLLPREVINDVNGKTSKDFINENAKRKMPIEDERAFVTKRTSIASNIRPIVPTTLNRSDKDRVFSSYLQDFGNEFNSKIRDEEWKNADNMLNSILEMVTKAKRTLFLLQQKDHHMRRLIETNEMEWRRRHAELMSQTEDRMIEARRKAEETVLEIKRQSIIDLQNALSQREQKSNETLTREREQYSRLNSDLKNQSLNEAYALFNRQGDGPEQCWHCGRKAIETCSGCNFARYCGPYCQHRDWDYHQKVCGIDLKRKWMENPQMCRRPPPSKSSFPTVSNEGTVVPMGRQATHRSTPVINVSSPTPTISVFPSEVEKPMITNTNGDEEAATAVKDETV